MAGSNRQVGGTHIVIFRWVDLLDEPLDDLLLIEPLGVRNKVGLRSLTPPHPQHTLLHCLH